MYAILFSTYCVKFVSCLVFAQASRNKWNGRDLIKKILTLEMSTSIGQKWN